MLTIVADDLTGACDTGTLFAGLAPVAVTVWPQALTGTPVRVIDTESRAVEAAEAARRVAAVVGGRPDGRYFKKLDSTLRGHVGAEVDALLRALGGSGALLTPAFPAQGRTVLDRILLIDGVPLAETTGRPHPESPRLDTSNVVDLLRPGLDRPLAWIPIAEVRAGPAALAARLTRLGGTVAVADAETDQDLDALVDAALALDPAPLLIGAAGLGRALAARLGLLAGGVALPRGRWLIVAGSRHPVTRAQIVAARAAGLRVLASADGDNGDEERVARELGREAARVLAREHIDLVAVSGGQTAAGLYRALEAERIDLLGAPGPGLAYGQVQRPGRPPLGLLTKAGGFGRPDVFVALMNGAVA